MKKKTNSGAKPKKSRKKKVAPAQSDLMSDIIEGTPEIQTAIAESETKPAPKIKMTSWFDDRFYRIENEAGEVKYFPSVTSVLSATPKPFLYRWRGDVGNELADKRMMEAGDRGTRIHHACYAISNKGCVIFNPWQSPNYTKAEIDALQSEYFDRPFVILPNQEEMYQVTKFDAWLKTVKPEIITSEAIVYSLQHEIAGTLDYLFKIQEGDYLVAGKQPLHLEAGLYIADLKTSKQLDDDHYMQIAAYAKLAQETGFEIKGAMLIHTTADTKFGIEGLTTKLSLPEQIETDWQDFLSVKQVFKRKFANNKPTIFEFPAILRGE